ncbi:hypothetical protein [Kitasatospora paranensis]|uniref:Uncharacterized protein n=1 Tax=Kitasatospora paranensis TaxID=258053 RepID=A0ABW2G001_9ACTN
MTGPSPICRHACAKTVFPTGEADALFGKKLDVFAEQHPGAAPAES